MECICFFSQHLGDPEVCKLLIKIERDDLLEWENQSATEYSPGPVNNGEILVRQIISPIHYDEENNTLAVTAFDDASNKGLSVNRLEYTSNKIISHTANERVKQYNEEHPEKNPQRSFAGSINFSCSDIRAITIATDIGSIRAFAVYDTAYEDDFSHADVCQIVARAYGRSARLSIRDLANKFLQTHPFSSGDMIIS